MLVEALSLSKSDADRLYHFKNPAYHPKGTEYIGDFVFVMKSVVGPFCPPNSVMNLQELDDFLEDISSVEENKKYLSFTRVIRMCTAADLEWICRIILKDLKIGIKQDKILPIYHPDALNQFNFAFNLRKVCEDCSDLSTSFQTSTAAVTLFQPVRPHLAARKTMNDIRILFMNTSFFVETKYDGERLQAHFDENFARFYSRNNHDVSEVYGRHLEPLLRSCVSAKAAVLDGEVVVVDRVTGRCVEFGKNKSVAHSENHEKYQLCCKFQLTEISSLTCFTFGV